MLLMAHMLALGVACAIFIGMMVLHRRARVLNESLHSFQKVLPPQAGPPARPEIWLAVRSVEPEAVRLVLPDEGRFLVSPRVNGWVIVTGPGLPNPGDNVDACFHFLISASRRLGHVQFFYAEKFSAHHAWARMDEGCVTRAYAWAGETVWNQGVKTSAEIALRMKCFGYGENPDTESWTAGKTTAAANMEKIPLLAARWGIDPLVWYRADGITGESSRFY
jgi:hypothetical protein